MAPHPLQRYRHPLSRLQRYRVPNLPAQPHRHQYHSRWVCRMKPAATVLRSTQPSVLPSYLEKIPATVARIHTINLPCPHPGRCLPAANPKARNTSQRAPILQIRCTSTFHSPTTSGIRRSTPSTDRTWFTTSPRLLALQPVREVASPVGAEDTSARMSRDTGVVEPTI